MAAVARGGLRSPSTAHDLTMIASSCCKLAAVAAFSLTSDHRYKSPASSEWRRRRPQPQQGPPQFKTFFALSRSKTHLTFGRSRRMRELDSARAMQSIVKLKMHIKSSSFCFGESQGKEAMLAVVVLYRYKLHSPTCPSSPPPPPPARVSHPQPVQTLPLKIMWDPHAALKTIIIILHYKSPC